MRYKLRSFVFSVVFSALNASPVHSAEDYVNGLKGSIFPLQNLSVSHIALREDGRYLFFALKGSSFNVLDLQDMARLGTATSVDADVRGLGMDGDARLIVLTKKGAQYFNLPKPYDIKEEATDYERPENDTLSVLEACFEPSSKVAFFLEQSSSSGDQHLLRLMKDKVQLQTLSWANLFSGNSTDLKPFAVRCGNQRAFVFAKAKESSRSEELWVSSVSAVGSVSEKSDLGDVLPTTYQWKDFILSPNKDRIFVLFNKKTPTSTVDDAVVASISVTSLTNRTTMNLGSGGRALVGFFVGDSQRLGLFVDKDILKSGSNPPLNQFLFGEISDFGTSSFVREDRGPGSASVGQRVGSLWLSSKDDVYAYGLTETLGVSLVSEAPWVRFSESPSGQSIFTGTPLRFKIISDITARYEVRMDVDEPKEGVTTGVELTPGSLFQSGTLSANQAQNFELNIDSLGIKTSKDLSLQVISRDVEGGAGSAHSRLGFRFSIDPPPTPVRNLRTGFGDQSVHVFFDEPEQGDVDSYLIYFSYTESDVETLNPSVTT